MSPAILLPASFGVRGAHRPLFAVADRLNRSCRNTHAHQRLLDGGSAVFAERQVIFGGPTLVAMALDRKAHARVAPEKRRVGLQRRLISRRQLVAVIVEIHVLDAAREQFLIAGRRCPRGGLRWRRGNGYAGGRFLASTFTVRGQPVGRRLAWGYQLRTGRTDFADSSQRDFIGVLGRPRERARLPRFDRGRIGGQGRRRRSRRSGRWRRWGGRNSLIASSYGQYSCQGQYDKNPLSVALIHFILLHAKTS